jgi:CheY-like chemotaxis protein
MIPRGLVLVVEDDQAIDELVAELLVRELCVAVAIVRDGPAALAAVRANPPDVVLLDLVLPDVDGFAVLRWLASSPCTAAIPVVAFTAAGPETVRRALEAGCAACVAKPFDLDDLVDAIRPYVGAAPAGPGGDDARVGVQAGCA